MEVWIYTEDSGKQAIKVWTTLLYGIFRKMDPEFQDRHLRFRSTEAREIKEIMRGNAWKGKTARADTMRRALIQEIADQLKLGRTVVFHYDGDTRWSEREECPHQKPFERLIKGGLSYSGVATDGFVLLVPHYSLESWLYLNRAVVEEIVTERPALSGVPGQLGVWLVRPGSLDEIPKIKDSCRLGDEFNERLSRSFPLEEARATSPSLSAAVAVLEACAPLRAGLAATHP